MKNKGLSNNNLKEIGKRLSKYLSIKNIGINEFGRLTQTSGAQVSFILNGRKYGVDKLLSILQVCPDLNPLWLLYGDEPMLNSNEGNNGLIKKQSEWEQEELEKKLLIKELDNLLHQLSNLKTVADVKDTMIENLNNTIKILQESNRDLKEMINVYKSLNDSKSRLA